MRTATVLAVGVGALGLPAAPAAASTAEPAVPAAPALHASLAGHLRLGSQVRAVARDAALERRALRLAARLARVQGSGFTRPRYARSLRTDTPAQLGRRIRRLSAQLRAAAAARAQAAASATAQPTTTAGATAGTSAPLQAIAACESGGDSSAVGGGGAYRGKYQFSPATWASVGGTGDPAAASPAEQDRRAAILYARDGASAWPVCGG